MRVVASKCELTRHSLVHPCLAISPYHHSHRHITIAIAIAISPCRHRHITISPSPYMYMYHHHHRHRHITATVAIAFPVSWDGKQENTSPTMYVENIFILLSRLFYPLVCKWSNLCVKVTCFAILHNPLGMRQNTFINLHRAIFINV
jgi:hypothetical protein